MTLSTLLAALRKSNVIVTVLKQGLTVIDWTTLKRVERTYIEFDGYNRKLFLEDVEYINIKPDTGSLIAEITLKGGRL